MVHVALLPKFSTSNLSSSRSKVSSVHLYPIEKQELRSNQSSLLLTAYSSARGGARNRIKPARDPIPRTGKKYPPKSPTLEAII